jgi:hypothetical protein
MFVAEASFKLTKKEAIVINYAIENILLSTVSKKRVSCLISEMINADQ